MQIKSITYPKNFGHSREKLYFSNGLLFFIALSTVFYARIFCSVTGAPGDLVHLHLFVVPFVMVVAMATSKIRDYHQMQVAWVLFAGLFSLLTTLIASAFLNQAGLINAVLQFLLLAEPFMLLLIILCIPVNSERVSQFEKWIIWSSVANMILAFVQWPLLKTGMIEAGGLDHADGMAGVFFVSGAGNYVSATVSIFFSLYNLSYIKAGQLWLRWLTVGIAFYQLQLSDSKQLVISLLLGWFGIILANTKKIGKTIILLSIFLVFCVLFYWGIYNLEFLADFRNYLDKDGAYGPDGEATLIKTAPFRIIPTHYDSFLDWFFGLGPGHTVTRLGGWLLQENWDILEPLGATVHPASEEIRQAYYNSWIAMESTVFSPMFGWAGIWGDLGLVGLGIYLTLYWITWRYLCFDDFSKYLLLTTMAFGFIFTQMEEPGYMLYTFAIIGFRWHKQRLKDYKRY